MHLDKDLTHKWLTEPPRQAWESIFEYVFELCGEKFANEGPAEVQSRDQALADVDLFLSTVGWDLWRHYEDSVPLTSKSLAHWWDTRQGQGKAVLILDGLSLRELPWILKYADEYGFRLRHAKVTGAELPADTNSFARALGFSQRSSLANGSVPTGQPLRHARTDTGDLPWADAKAMVRIKPELGWCYWHHWPDNIIHRNDEQGKGLSDLAQDIRKQFWEPSFWDFVEVLGQGRHVVVTSDHGYAASGRFPDADERQNAYLRNRYGKARFAPVKDEPEQEQERFAPPIDMTLKTRHGRNSYVLGRRKWKVQGGYPTLVHGGLSILEVAVPWVVLTKGEKGE